MSGSAPTIEDIAAVTRLLGRPPMGAFEVVVRGRDGGPIVIENAPFLDDGTPMPTRYWLVGAREQQEVGRLESSGGILRATEAVPEAAVTAAHARYAAMRDALVPHDRRGPRPTGGVGGTRTGIKCLHAHLAAYLAGSGDPVGRWVAGELSGRIDGSVAAVDLGTNSTRVLVVDRGGATVAREMTITRLGEGVDRTGLLLPTAVERTLDALRAYRTVLDRHGVVAVRVAATSAARDAANAELLFDGVAAVLGVRPELLSGEEEGRLAYAGATADVATGPGPYLVCDLGGGSTELVAGGPDGAVAASISLPLGCVRVTERFLGSDPPSASELEAAREHVGSLVDDARRALSALGVPISMIGLAGTVSALTALSLGLDAYDHDRLHHATLERAEVERFLAELKTMTAAERRGRPGLEPARTDVIVGGALVLAVVMERFAMETLTYSESDILDGIVADLRRRLS